MVLQPGRANAVPDFPFGGLAGGADVPEFNRAKEELLRYLDEDDAIVRSGTRSAEKREGTAARGASIRGAIDNPPPGATPEEIASGILSSRRTGDIIRTTPAPAALDPATRGAYIEEVLNQHAAGRITDFQAGTAIDALNLARTGRLTEDAQKTLMRSILGEGLPPSAVGVTPAAGPRRRPRAGGLPGAPPRTPATTGPTLVGRTRRGVNRPLKPPRIGPPTPPRPPVLNVGAELAAAARKFKAAQLPRRTAAPVPGRSSLASVNQAELSELNMARKLIPEPLKPPRRGTGAASGAKPDILGPDIGIGLVGDENVLRTIKRMPNVPDDVQEAIRIWLEANRVRLDAIGPEWNQTFTNIRASLSGNVADSFVTALLHRKSNLQQALRRTGIVENDELVKSLVDDLFEMELRKRFGFDVPPRVRNMLAEARSTEGLADLGSFELAAQRVKNTIFGFADIGVFGVQVQASLVRNGVAGIVGMVNRILAASHIHDFRPLYTSTVGNRQVQYAVDGLGQGVGPSAVRSELGTILQYLGPVGRTIDRPVTAISAWLNQMQFGNILQWVRDSTHEGNLMILHLTGNDIADPAVRRASAESANMASSWAHQALRRSRGAAETTVLTSPMMTRAQFAHVRQLMNALNPASGANRAERTLAAVSIASTAIYSLVIGKGIHDLVGKGDFTFDPREPGFGFLTLANGTVINMFPQTSFVDAIARSFGALVEQDAKGVWEAWARFGLGRTSFLSSNVLSAAGVGFEPGSGFRFGDLSPDARLLNLAPLPPIIQQAVTEGVDLDQLILEGIGVSAFDESSFGMERRTFNDEHSGLDFDDASRADRRDHLAAHPEIEELRMEERQTLARRGDRLSQALLIANNDDPSVPGVNGLGTRQRLANLEQLSIDERTGVVDHGGYRSARRTILSEQRGKSSAYDDVLDDFAESDDEAERDAARLYELYDEAKDIAELPDFDLFAELEANLQQELGLERWTSAQVIVNGIDPRDNPLEQEYQQALNAVAASGLFRVSDDAWADMQGLTPLLREFPSFFEYRDQVVNDFIQLSMLSNPAFSDGEHRDEANRRFNNSRVVKQYRDVRSAHRAAWRATAPPEAVDFAETWELIDTTLESRAGTITKQRLLDLDRQLTAAP